jgi:HEAT repeats
MNVFGCRAIFRIAAGLVLLLVTLPSARCDEVSLKSGGSVQGKVVRSGTTVAVTSPKGTRVVLDRSDIQKIEREAPSPAADKSRLAPSEKVWLTKVRRLLRQAGSADREVSARALRDLRAIHDPDALPALMKTLRTSDLADTRLLYVRILSDIRGATAVVGLVEEALFDSSGAVRDAAQEISKNQRAEDVRPYYGQALRYPNREVVCRAASVLGSIGGREYVPYLIDSLYSKTVDVELRPSCCMSRVTYLSAPATGLPYNTDNLVTHGDRIISSHRGDHLVPTLVVRRAENPQVKDALEAITQQSFGYNANAWRRWWHAAQLAENSSGR